MEQRTFGGGLISWSPKVCVGVGVAPSYLAPPQAAQEDLTGKNYLLIKEYMLEFGGEAVPTAADHQATKLQLPFHASNQDSWFQKV